MRPADVLTYVRASPFRPFRIVMNSGRSYEIRHPEMIKVATSVIIIFKYVSDNFDVFDSWDTASLDLIERIQYLPEKAAKKKEGRE